ncbi:hypothetical protein [Kamptonema sp. UHCC 0994]|uniref:hypothetical protein n=1 Tax=Kamptonema sp. UHCC 0994 TaxID=3031329 RepID=UPI0023B9C255|nr:hypothetical protein [Kamptonema sp. UHCC 0994]MDF0551602.1 hypothetical protein [Kamptonema sp. UHCC 0994]
MPKTHSYHDYLIKSQGKVSIMAEEDQQNWDQLQELLKASGGEEIYRFMALLKALGLKIEIAVSVCANPASLLQSAAN